MIINKLTPLWTDENKKAWAELTEQARTIWDATPEGERLTADSLKKYDRIQEERQAILDEISGRYIKSFRRKNSAVFDDIREIVDSITKEDYQDTIREDAFIFASLESGEAVQKILDHPEEMPTESYQGCFEFIASHLQEQFKVIARYKLSKSRAHSIIDSRVSKWYINNFPAVIPTAYGIASQALASITAREAEIDNITGRAIIRRQQFELSIEDYNSLQGGLGVPTHKLFMFAVGKFTDTNSRNLNQHTNLRISFDVKDYARILGKDIDPHPGADPIEEEKRIKRQLNEVQKDIKKSLDVLYSYSLSWEERIKNKQTAFSDIRILGAKGLTRKGTVIVEFSGAMGDYLKSLPLTQFPITQYRIDGRNQNAYAMGNKIVWYHYMDSNQKQGNGNRLKVETLLRECKKIYTIEKVIEQQASWQAKIKEPFENALDEITRAGTIKDWKYTHAKGIELTEDEAQNITDYYTFKDLYITFEIGTEVDSTERIERRAERKLIKANKKTTQKK